MLQFFFKCINIPFKNQEQSEGTSTTTKTVANSKDAFTALFTSFSTIIVSEIGDKTFILAAIMSMKYNRVIVFMGAGLALILMTAISAGFGSIVPSLIPIKYTRIISTILFFIFGGIMLREAMQEKDDDQDEKQEIIIELNQMESSYLKKQIKNGENDEGNDIESKPLSEKYRDEFKGNIGPKITKKIVFWQALSMTFLAEWGDRSQFTCIALASRYNGFAVFLGSTIGHLLCSSLAVIGGRYISDKISEKTVNLLGGVLFIIFGIHSFYTIL